MPLKRQGPTFALCRILGNDLPPLHSEDQTPTNLRFTLAHELPLDRCTQSFILNRIVDPKRRDALRQLITAAGHAVHVIEFDRREYDALETRVDRANYLTNNNGARNLAVEIGLARADVTLPFDGQIFFSAEAWTGVLADVGARKSSPVFIVPMIRLMQNREALLPEHLRPHEQQSPSEPQVMWSRKFTERFDEAIPYGRGSKAELLIRLGVPGVWDHWPGPHWDEIRARPLSPFAGQAGSAGFCYRLASGNPRATTQVMARYYARHQALGALVDRVDADRARPPRLRGSALRRT